MAIISGVTVRWGISPRLIVMPLAAIEATLEDLQDTLQDIEDDSQGMPFDKLRSLSGGQELDASTSVGFTMQLNNAQLIWATNVDLLDSGTITTPDTDGLTLTDSTGLFVTNGVSVGDMVVNTTDGSHATVLSVASETAIDVDGLVGGVDNQFDSADGYEVYGWQLRSLTGGNLVAINSSGTSIDPVINSFGNSFDRTSSSSATNSSSSLIEEASFLGGVWVDVIEGSPGSSGLIGNKANPVDNMSDAAAIDIIRNFKKYYIEKSLTLNAEGDWTDHTFVGHSIIDTVITVNPIADVTKTIFTECSIEGDMGSTTLLDRCFLGETNPLTNVRGVITNCSIGPSPLTLGGGPADGGSIADQVRMNDCRAAGLAFSPPTINGNGDGPQLVIQGHIGTLNLANKTGEAPWKVTIDGDLTIESTCTNGVIEVFGQGSITDNSGPNCTVLASIIDGSQIRKVWKRHGLDPNNPLTDSVNFISTPDGDISVQRDRTQSMMSYGDRIETLTSVADPAITLELPLTSDLVELGGRTTGTFTRGSTGTYVDITTGLITSAGVDTPRFEAGGILLEGSRTNICLQSEALNVTWGNVRTTDSQAVGTSPDGTNTANSINEDGTAGNSHYVFQGVGTLNASQYTLSAFAKASNRDWFMLRTSRGSVYDVSFDLGTGVLGTAENSSSGTIDALTGSWYRCSGTTPVLVSGAGTAILLPAEADTDEFYDGGTQESTLAWGMQVEEGTVSTSYMPTTTSSFTRSADLLTYDDDTVISDAAGTLIVEVTPLFGTADVNEGVVINIADQLEGPLYIVNDAGTQKFAFSDGTNVTTFDPTFVRGQPYTVGVRWSGSEVQLVVDGVAGTPGTYGGSFVRSVGTLYVGSSASGNYFNGNIRLVKAYNNDRGEDQLKVDTG